MPRTGSGGAPTRDLVRWNAAEQCVEAKNVTKFGALILAERQLPIDDDRVLTAMTNGVRELGLQALPWTTEAQSLRDRSEWLRSTELVDKQWPNLSEERMMESLETWLKPFLSGIRQRSQLSKVNLNNAMRSLFTFRQLKDLERLAPDRIKLPSGSSGTIKYGSGSSPVLAVRLQELFGQINTPQIGDGKVPVLVHLLSPARRPLAVTQDLPSFWKTVYPGIRNQMRAKYPKHVWPEDPLTATPTSRTKRQRGAGG